MLAVCCIACMPFQFQTAYGFQFAPSDLFVAMGCVVLVAGGISVRRSSGNSALLGLWAVLTISLWTTLSRTGSLSRYVLLNKYCGLLELFALYWFFANAVRHEEDARWLMRVFVIVVSVQNCVFLPAYIGAHWFGFTIPVLNPGLRLAGFLLDPNAYGGLLACALALQLLTCRSGAHLVQGKAGVLVLATLAAGLLFTFSRSAALACLAVVSTGILLRARVVIPAVVFLAAIGAAYWAYGAGAEDRSFIARMAARPEQIDQRKEGASRALEEFTNSPVFGAGIGANESHIIHNTSLWFLGEMGLVGFAALCWFLGSTASKAVFCARSAGTQMRTIATALLCAHAGMFGLSMGIEAFYQRHWWFVMSMISALATILRTRLSVRSVRPHRALAVAPFRRGTPYVSGGAASTSARTQGFPYGAIP